MVRCDLREGVYLSCCLLYRGNIASRKEINEAINFVKRTKSIRFVDWTLMNCKVITHNNIFCRYKTTHIYYNIMINFEKNIIIFLIFYIKMLYIIYI